MNIRLITSRYGFNLVAVYYKISFIEQVIITTIVGGVFYVAENYVTMSE